MKKITVPTENYDGSRRLAAPQNAAAVVSLGIAGLVIGIGGYFAVMLSSAHSGWWSAPYIVTLLVCGALAATFGIMATVKSGKLPKFKTLAKIIGITSAVVGCLIVGLVGSLLVLMLMLSASIS